MPGESVRELSNASMLRLGGSTELHLRRLIQQLGPSLEIFVEIIGVVDLAIEVPDRGEVMMTDDRVALPLPFEHVNMSAVVRVLQIDDLDELGWIENDAKPVALVIRL